MKTSSLLPLGAPILVCSMLMGFSPTAVAATATNLVTICTSATTTTQAGKCTAWQYNVYSPTAYIESYPTVKPAESGINDPNYEYRLGSTITASMGVKVCPTALTPGVSFFSEQADPCPNNVLVSASTVLPTNTYAVSISNSGIVVYQVNTSSVSQVTGSPFSADPGNASVPPGGPPYSMALDPTGQYFYCAFVFTETGGTAIASFKMVNGVPQALSMSPAFTPGRTNQSIGQMVATAQHLYAGIAPDQSFPEIVAFDTSNGVFSATGGLTIQLPLNLPTTSPSGADNPISFSVDPQEKFLYWFLSSTGGTVSDTVAIYSLDFATSSATLVSVVSQSGTILLGAQ
jgi:hypothetical protein